MIANLKINETDYISLNAVPGSETCRTLFPQFYHPYSQSASMGDFAGGIARDRRISVLLSVSDEEPGQVIRLALSRGEATGRQKISSPL